MGDLTQVQSPAHSGVTQVSIANCSGSHLASTWKPPKIETPQSVRATSIAAYCLYGPRKHSLLSSLDLSCFSLCPLSLWLIVRLCRVHCLLSDIPFGAGVQLGNPKASSAPGWQSPPTPAGFPCSASRHFGPEGMELGHFTSLRLLGPA